MSLYQKILLFGSDGQVGWELQSRLSILGRLTCLNRAACDLINPTQISRALKKYEPEIIVNAAAYTSVDQAEVNESTAYRINVEAVAQLSRYARETGALLVHYSTEYIFDGNKLGAYCEDDIAKPLGVYGRTKLHGENRIREALCRHLIFRTSWVYGVRGNNFPRTILSLARHRASMEIIADQIGAPTSAELIADITAHAIRDILFGHAPGGTYHLAASGETSWHNYAQFVVKQARAYGWSLRLDVDGLKPVSTSDYPLPAKRPKNSRLDTSLLERNFRLNLPSWEIGVIRVLNAWRLYEQ